VSATGGGGEGASTARGGGGLDAIAGGIELGCVGADSPSVAGEAGSSEVPVALEDSGAWLDSTAAAKGLAGGGGGVRTRGGGGVASVGGAGALDGGGGVDTRGGGGVDTRGGGGVASLGAGVAAGGGRGEPISMLRCAVRRDGGGKFGARGRTTDGTGALLFSAVPEPASVMRSAAASPSSGSSSLLSGAAC